MPTPGRSDQLVLAALKKSGKPMSAYEILDRARSQALKAPVQVYRALQKLQRLGLVHRVEALNAFVACSDRHEDLHRPGFVICRDCGAVREFQDGRVANLARKAAGSDFSIDLIALEIYGRCGSCAAAH
ncbi:MAG: Fur family transcriptional regulator [Propylenella sp.]